MRIGDNPQRDKKVDLGNYFHQVIVPVYIPNVEGYYKSSFEVFKLSILSIIKTSHAKTYISIISNGSCKEVTDYIADLFKANKIHDFVVAGPIGKVNAILKGLAGSNFSMVTITDGDVLFLNDWQKATYAVYEHFPKAGVVGIVPNPSLGYYKTANIFRDNLFSKKIKSSKIKNVNGVLKFAESVGQLDYFKSKYADTYLTVSNKNFKAVLGCGHFVATYRSEIFDLNFIRKTEYVLGGDSEECLLDDKALQSNLWRLATEDNYAYHLGNAADDWAFEQFKNLTDEDRNFNEHIYKHKIKIPFFVHVYTSFANKIFGSYKFQKLVLRKKFKN